MVRKQCFHLPISKIKLLKNLFLVANLMTLKQNFYSYLYLENHQQEKAAYTNDYAEKEAARKELIIRCLTVVIFCFCDLYTTVYYN